MFTDGSARRGGGGSSAGSRTDVLSAVWKDEQKLDAADRMTSISKGGRDIWAELKSRMGLGLRGGRAPPMNTWGGRSEAGGTTVSTRSRVGRHVPGRLPGVCEVHHIGLDDYERATKKAEVMYREKMRTRERERRERLMAEQQGIPLQPRAPRKKKTVRRDWDNRSLETMTTLAAPALTATPLTGRRKDYEYESYVQETPARPRGWKPGDSEIPDISRGYDPKAYVNPEHLSHHISTRTNRSYVPGDDPGDVPPPIRMKPKRQSMPPPSFMRPEPIPLNKSSTKEYSGHTRGSVKREKSHRNHHHSTKTKEVGGKGYIAAATKEVGRDRKHSRRRSSRRQASEKVEPVQDSSSEKDTSSSEEDYSETDSSDYTTESSEDEKGPTLGTKIYHHPLPKRDVWSEVIASGSGSSGRGSGNIARNSGNDSESATAAAYQGGRAKTNATERANQIPASAGALPSHSRVGQRPRTGSIVAERVNQLQSRANAATAVPSSGSSSSNKPPPGSIRALPGGPGTITYNSPPRSRDNGGLGSGARPLSGNTGGYRRSDR